MKDNRWGIVPVIWRTAQPTNIHFVSCNYTYLFTWAQASARILYHFSVTHYNLPWSLQLKITKFIIFQFLSTGAVARHKSFFKLFYKFFEIFLFCTMLTVTFLLFPDPPSQLVSFCFQHSKSILCSPSILGCVVLLL